MTKIRALRQFSHYHAGSFNQFEVRVVKDDYAEALIGMGLAEDVDADPILKPEPEPEPEPEPTTPVDLEKKGSKK